MVQNLAETERLDSKCFFELNWQISLKVLTKVGINFAHFARKKVNEMKPIT
jgi:hypothetical protein